MTLSIREVTCHLAVYPQIFQTSHVTDELINFFIVHLEIITNSVNLAHHMHTYEFHLATTYFSIFVLRFWGDFPNSLKTARSETFNKRIIPLGKKLFQTNSVKFNEKAHRPL